MEIPELILVTGASGYIASHCIKLLLEKGHKVRGTVRNLQDQNKYKFLYDIVPEKKDNIQLVEANLSNVEVWDSVVKGCTHVLHIASPIPPYIPQNEDEIIKPAVEGTKNVFNAAIRQGVKKFVFTSSCLTIMFSGENKILDENDWSDVNKCAHYPKSKILAEQAAWEIFQQNQDKIQFTSVLPSLVFGPLFKKHGNSSEALMAEILKGSFPGIPDPDCNYTVVDVRDTADTHYKALFSDISNNNRYISAGQSITISQIIEILQQEFSKYGYEFKTQKLNAQQIKDSGNQIAQRSIMLMGKILKINNQKSIDQLGMQYRNINQTVIDMAYSLIKQEIVEDKIKHQ